MSDLGDGEVRTTTTRVDPATGGSESYTTTEPRRGAGSTVWIVLGLVAVIAIVALVYLFTQNSASQQTALDQAAVNQQLGAAQANAEAATRAAGSAASAATDAASNAANRAADRASATASSAAAATGDAATTTTSETPPSSSQP